MRIGAALASFIRDKETSAADICRTTGIKPASMSKYISDEQLPPLDKLALIAKNIGVHVCEIIARAEGVKLGIEHENEDQKQARKVMESLDAQERYKMLAIARILISDKSPE